MQASLADCFYVNTTPCLQVVRISNISGWFFERVVSPGHRMQFKAPAQAVLEIHSGSMINMILEDQIPCARLQGEYLDLPTGALATISA